MSYNSSNLFLQALDNKHASIGCGIWIVLKTTEVVYQSRHIYYIYLNKCSRNGTGVCNFHLYLNKMKSHSIETIPKSNRKFTETPNTNTRPLSPGLVHAIICDCVNLALWARTPLSEMIRLCKCCLRVSKMLTFIHNWVSSVVTNTES